MRTNRQNLALEVGRLICALGGLAFITWTGVGFATGHLAWRNTTTTTVEHVVSAPTTSGPTWWAKYGLPFKEAVDNAASYGSDQTMPMLQSAYAKAKAAPPPPDPVGVDVTYWTSAMQTTKDALHGYGVEMSHGDVNWTSIDYFLNQAETQMEKIG